MRYRIGDLVEIIDGDRGANYPKQDEFYDEGYCLFLNTGNVTKNGFSFSSNQFITQEKDSKLRKGKLTRNDIVYTTRGTVGNAAFYSPSVEFENIRINSGMIIIRKKDEVIDQNYLYQALKSDTYRNIFLQYCSGSAQPQLPIKTFSKIKIDIPSISTQKIIADILSYYDELIENNNKRIKLLEQMAENLYKEWFVRFRFPNHENTEFENGIPKGWKIEPISKNNKCFLGGTPSREVNDYWESGTIPWINSGAINQFRICEESELITPLALEKSAAKLLPLRSTLIAITGATLGQVSMNEIEVCANQSVVGIINQNGHASFMYFVIKQNIKHIANFASGGAQQHINKEIIGKYKIISPSITLLDEFEKIVSSYFDAIRDIIFMNKNLKKQRDLLLPRLMSGKLEV